MHCRIICIFALDPSQFTMPLIFSSLVDLVFRLHLCLLSMYVWFTIMMYSVSNLGRYVMKSNVKF